MVTRRTLTISITPEQDDLIRGTLQTGRFASASEVVRAALRLFERDEARQRRWQAGQKQSAAEMAVDVADRP